MLEVFRVNDAIHSWNSCRHLIDVEPFSGVVSVDFNESRERKLVYGGRRDGLPLGMTTGKYDPGVVGVKYLSDQWDLVSTYLTEKGLGSIGDATFTHTIESSEGGDVEVPVIITLATGCRVQKVHQAFEEGIEENLVEVELRVMQLVTNGKVLFSLARNIL